MITIIEIPTYSGISIYAIHNKENNKYYIGSSKNTHQRLSFHLRKIMSLGGINKKMIFDLNSSNINKILEFLIIEHIDDGTLTYFELFQKEAYYINLFNAKDGYNYSCQSPFNYKSDDKNKLVFTREKRAIKETIESDTEKRG